MVGAPISRWTMSYFASALAFLVLGLALMGSGFGFPTADVGSPDTLVVVHIIALGWLGLLFCGALLQFVPVLAATKLRMPQLSAPSLLFIVGGLFCLLAGFLSLAGRLGIDSRVMLLGALLLATGLGSLILSVAATILTRKVVDLSGRLVLLGLLALLATVALGSSFAVALTGISTISWLFDLLAVGIPVHGASGLLGWMTLTAVGVSYRLFSMFMLAPENGFSTRRVTAGAAAGLVALYGGLGVLYFHPAAATAAGLFGVALALGTAAFYLRDLATMFRARRRRQLELNTQAGFVALIYLALGLLMLGASQILDTGLPIGPAAYYILGLGWLSGLGLSQLYKIVPFLTWLEAYGPIMGRAAVPRIQDLVNESRARAFFFVYHAAVLAAAASLLSAATIGFRLAAWCQCAAVLGLIVEYAKARRLSYAPENVRLPGGAVRPRLIYANAN